MKWKKFEETSWNNIMEIWNWKQVEIILWKEQRDRGRNEISVKKEREKWKS